MSMISPMQGRFTSGFMTAARRDHAGIDIAPPVAGTTGGAVRAMFAGTVYATEAGQKPGEKTSGIYPGHSGNGVIIKNVGKGSSDDGERQIYNHVRPAVTVGDTVKAGDIIGHLDRSGNQTGPHLHLGCLDADGDFYDPQKCFRKYGVGVGSKPDASDTDDSKPAAKPKDYDPEVKAYQDRQIYYPNMVRDGIDGPKNKAHKAWVKELQRTLNLWKSDLPDLVEDGDYSGKTGAKVREIQTRNKAGAYRRAGGRKVDRIAGPVMCRMLSIRKHPEA